MPVNPRWKWALSAMLALHTLLSWQLFNLGWSEPALVVEMSSTVASEAQVYFDRGNSINESDSVKIPVLAAPSQRLRLLLPFEVIRFIRFDPIANSGEVIIHKAEVLRPDGSVAASFTPAKMRTANQIDQREVLPNGLRLRVNPPNTDPQLHFDLDGPLDLTNRTPGGATLRRVLIGNFALLVAELLFIFGMPKILARVRVPLAIALVVLHTLLTALLLHFWSSAPALEVEMASTVFSRAEVHWDIGAGLSEGQLSSLPVRATSTPQLLRFALPNGLVKALRFDPLKNPGTIVIRRAAVLRSDGTTALTIAPSQIRGIIGFDQVALEPEGLRYRIRTDSLKPELALDLNAPIDLQSTYPGNLVLARTALWNVGLLLIEFLLFVWPPGVALMSNTGRTLDALAIATAARLSNQRFIVFDRLAIWFYLGTIAIFLISTLADLNGSSMGVFWANFKVGAPAHVVAGVPQEIRADEFNYQTPGMLNQYFRAQPFAVNQTASGGHSVGLLAELPVRHVTTWVRPQFWPFFALPADYAFSAWWQAKGLIMVTGVFTLLLLLTQSSLLSIVGSLWLLFSQFTQWCYSWPSMLPEMAGLFCLTVVCAAYLTIGANRWALIVAAISGAACAINFALSAYVPHQIPFVWVGVVLFAGWCAGNRREILRGEGAIWRLISFAFFLGITGALLVVIVNDTRFAVDGIAATLYPGHRVLSGGGYSLTTFATHFLAATENVKHFPPEYSNINEAAGFLWLAPVTLFCMSKMRALPSSRRVILATLWLVTLLFVGWMVLPIPPSVGRLFYFDRAQGVRFLPALGLVNVCIVMLVLSSPDQRRRLGIDAKLTITVPVVFAALFLANQNVHQYFQLSEIIWGSLWATVLIVLLLDGRRLTFGLAVVIPNLILFGLINPVQRGIYTITDTPIFELVQQNSRLRDGKWLVFSKGFPAAIFTAVGCDVFNGMRYLPDLDHFPLLASRGVDTNIMNNLGYVNVEQLEPGQPPSAKLGPFGPTLSISPLDPLVKQLGVRYVAFHDRPPQNVLDHLKPLIDGSVSEFWIYELE